MRTPLSGKNIIETPVSKHASSIIITLMLSLTFLGQAGCSAPKQLAKSKPIQVNTEMDTLWPICKTALKNRGFDIDYQNLQQGIIETHSLTSKQWFELWHSDVVDAPSLMESSMHTIQRQVNLKITPIGDKQHEIKCNVNVHRLSLAQDYSSNAVRTRSIFSNVNMRETNEAGKSKIQKQWIPLGNDSALENAILKSIASKL